MAHEAHTSSDALDPADWSVLLPRVRRGDDDAARATVERLYEHVRRIVLAHLPRREEPEDLMQETFLKVFHRLDQYRGKVAFEHWVARIAVHVCLDRLRRQRARPEWRWADLTDQQQAQLGAAVAGTETVSAPAECARELLDSLLARLKPDARLVVRWLDLEQKTIAEVAALTGWSPAVVRIRAFRARRALRNLYRQWEHSRP